MGTESDIDRRRYLAAVSGAVSLSGCIGLGSDDGGGFVEKPALINLALQYIGIGTVTVEFVVEKDQETVHDETYELEGVDPRDVEEGAGAIGTNVGDVRRFEGEPWMAERARYAVTTDLQGGGAGSYTTEKYLEEYGDRDCPEFVIVVGVVNREVFPKGGPAPPDCINPIPVP
jgi:hypothetical protein